MDQRPIDKVTAVIIYLVVVYATIYIGGSLVQPYINGGGAKTFTKNTFTEILNDVLNDVKSCINDDHTTHFENFAKRVKINDKNTLMIKNLTDDEMNVLIKDKLLQKYIKSNSIKSNSIKSNSIKSNSIKSNSIKSKNIKSNSIKSKNIKSKNIKSKNIEILLDKIHVNECINKIKELDTDNIIVTSNCINKIEKMTTPLRG